LLKALQIYNVVMIGCGPLANDLGINLDILWELFYGLLLPMLMAIHFEIGVHASENGTQRITIACIE
jgi:hypothetical protein